MADDARNRSAAAKRLWIGLFNHANAHSVPPSMNRLARSVAGIQWNFPGSLLSTTHAQPFVS